VIRIHLFVYFVSCGDIWKIEIDGGGGGEGPDRNRWEIERGEREGKGGREMEDQKR
jgi:hypothetical protein